MTATANPDALPQPIGEFRPLDEWQAHINTIFYGLRGARLREFYQSFAIADYRLAHALAADYYERTRKREKARSREKGREAKLTVVELGCKNGNLAACFLTHLKSLDKERLIYPRLRYVLVHSQAAMLESALAHPDLAPHRSQVETLQAKPEDLQPLDGRTVDFIICSEFWNELPTKLMLRKEGEIEEEHLRPNLSEAKQAAIEDWSGFVKAFEAKDIGALKNFPSFLEDLIWEREYHKVEWKAVPYRKTITEFLKQIDEKVLVPVNLGACATMKEARRVLAEDAIGLSSFDAGTADLKLLNDPDKPCYGQFGGQYSFMVNFALLEAVARHLGMAPITIESQREFVGRSLGTNVVSLMDLLATHPRAGSLKPWEQEKLTIQTIQALNTVYHSPYQRTLDFSLSKEIPAEERQALEQVLRELKPDGVPDTIAYVTEEEIMGAKGELERLGYDPEMFGAALMAPPHGLDYYHFSFRQ